MSFANNTPRYEALNSDEARLPDGMERVGYDEQTSTYTYLDHTDNSYWEGEAGSRYGVLHRQGHPRDPVSQSYSSSAKADCAYFLPFALIICMVLATFFWYVGGTRNVKAVHCGEGWESYVPVRGDTCWSIVDERGLSVEELLAGNLELACGELKAGWPICVPSVREGGLYVREG
ncbi:uncharacterized protein RCC_07273 [Ramularia collo-cygni]|uniref:LysM domain-containing protein n=1 Tax=Ramularia collo-cygni TaxID=112498 RepID=A0A2D3V7K4_9PEZI|nr:uncharacterized protein RCC_07273 [Ramularia collo-cygni]CZT21410.1 uncharacterized protein RCC_07273 [Ramularia collo-cygni]